MHKHRGPIRQLSVQGSSSNTCREDGRRLRRQSSADPALCIGISKASSSESLHKHNPTIRPKPSPARFAWGDNRPSPSTVSGPVEIIAQRCAGQPRPSSRNRTPNFSYFEKESYIPTRQLLAQRLRKAWKERERKPNLDIFLAHSRPDSVTSNESENILTTPLSTCDRNEENPKLFMLRTSSFMEHQPQGKENIQVEEKPSLTAAQRRASFKNISSFINQTIIDDDDSDCQPPIQVQVVNKADPPDRAPLVRTWSAPVEKSEVVETVTPLAKKEKCPIKLEQKVREKRKKSKPLVVSESKTNDVQAWEENSFRGRMGPRGSDVITMVSLVSPAGSDSEDEPAITNPASLVQRQEVAPSPEEPEIDNQSTSPPPPLILHNTVFASLRKTTKTVSFQTQQPSGILRSNSANLTYRRLPVTAPPIRAIITPPAVIRPEIKPEILETKQSLNIKLVPEKVEKNNAQSTNAEIKEEGSENDQEEEETPVINFKTAKEKECWLLYQKMLNKGVSVSFETILRGMLTPTEYRQRRHDLIHPRPTAIITT